MPHGESVFCSDKDSSFQHQNGEISLPFLDVNHLISPAVIQEFYEGTKIKRFSFSQWAKIELTLYKDQQFAAKQDQYFVLENIPVFSIKMERFVYLFEVNQ